MSEAREVKARARELRERRAELESRLRDMTPQVPWPKGASHRIAQFYRNFQKEE